MSIGELDPNFVATPIAIFAMVIGGWAESIHARRCRAAGRLAFGPTGRPRPWSAMVPPLRVAALTALAWGSAYLALAPAEGLNSAAEGSEPPPPEQIQRVILLLDVSPSMAIVDAGANRGLARRARLLEVMKEVFPRISLGRTRFSIVAFFTSARPVVVDAYDTAVIANALDSLPLLWAFEPGKTNVIEGLKTVSEMARDWAAGSATLILCTDGDTVDFNQIPKLPRAFRQVQIYAVGDPIVGTFIDGHDSRQQAGTLQRLAAELGGAYYDVNTRLVPSAAMAELTVTPPPPPKRGLTWKDLALLATAVGAALLLALPLLLEYFGAAWNAARELPRPVLAGAPRGESAQDELMDDDRSYAPAHAENIAVGSATHVAEVIA